jgi:hypothetical protein
MIRRGVEGKHLLISLHTLKQLFEHGSDVRCSGAQLRVLLQELLQQCKPRPAALVIWAVVSACLVLSGCNTDEVAVISLRGPAPFASEWGAAHEGKKHRPGAVDVHSGPCTIDCTRLATRLQDLRGCVARSVPCKLRLGALTGAEPEVCDKELPVSISTDAFASK